MGTKPLAVLLAGTIGVLGPGLAPMQATAQQRLAQADNGAATPPPISTSVPQDTGAPDKNYIKDTECIRRAGELDKNVVLREIPWGQQFLRLDEVHRLMRNTTGSVGGGITVAVIDTGVTATHPHLEGRVTGGGDYVKTTDAGPGLEDCDGHGTEVAGIIAADTPEDIGFQGVAPDSQIVSIRQSSQNYKVDDSPEPPADAAPPEEGGEPGEPGGEPGEPSGESQPESLTAPGQEGGGRTQDQGGTAGNLTTLAQAVVNATNRDVDVVNISINACRPASQGAISSGEAQLQAAVDYAVERDTVVVSAAGNVGESCEQNTGDPDSPKSIVTPPWFAEDVLSVAAIDEDGGVAEFSMHGPWVSVAAPGTGIISLDPAVNSEGLANLTIENGDAQPIRGTSFAAPYVTGLVALVRAKYPGLDAREVMNRIKSTAMHPAAPDGRDNFVGHGVINPMAALTETVREEQGLARASAESLPSDMPPPNAESNTPMIVALAGSGGALAALLVTLFVVHTIRRNRVA